MEGFQTSNSESEQLVFDFFHNRGSDKTKPDLVDLDPLASALTTLVVPPVGCAKGDIYMVSSDTEEEEEPFVPLALRLKQKPNNLHSQLGTHELWVSGNSNKNLKIHPEPVMADDLMNIHDDLDTRNHHSASSAKELVAVTEKRRLPSAEIGNRREVGLRRKVQREKQQVEKGQRKMEKRALVDTVKALRPEECLKHIIIVVDPGLLQLEGGGELLNSLHGMGCSCAIEKQPVPRSVCWIRRTTCPQQQDFDNIVARLHTSARF